MDTKVSDLNKMVTIALILRKVCNSFGPSCSYYKKDAVHPLPQNSDWSSEDWDSIKAKAKEQSKSLIDINDPKPKANIEQAMDIDKVPFGKPQIGQINQMEEPLEVMESLVPPPLPPTEAAEA